MAAPERIEITRGDTGEVRFELARRAAAAPLRSAVSDYCGYTEERLAGQRHQHMPHGAVTWIVSLDGTLEVEDPAGRMHPIRSGEGFLAGLHTGPATTRSGPKQRGVQVSLTPLGAHRLLGGLPMHELANRSLPLEALLGSAARGLAERLGEARDAGALFDAIDGFFAARLARPAPAGAAAVGHAWHALRRSHGRLRIGELGRELGWSRKRLVAAFRERIGLTPKTSARVLRFDHALQRVRAQAVPDWSELALACGYTDQAHLAREFRSLSGLAPRELLRQMIPGAGDLSAG